MTGICKPGKHQHTSSDPLAIEQFLSAFVLLMFGILLAFLLLGCESAYFKYARQRIYKKRNNALCCGCGCCRLISVVSPIEIKFKLRKLQEGNLFFFFHISYRHDVLTANLL